MTTFLQEYQVEVCQTASGPEWNLWCWYRKETESYDEKLPSARRQADGTAWPVSMQDQRASLRYAQRCKQDVDLAAARLGIDSKALDDARTHTARWPRGEWRRLAQADERVNETLRVVRERHHTAPCPLLILAC